MSHLIELTHDEHSHPHEVEHAVEEHPEHPGRAGGDLGQVDPEPILGIVGGTVDSPVWMGERGNVRVRRALTCRQWSRQWSLVKTPSRWLSESDTKVKL